jgi:excisionase family DNA binding protein
MQSPSGSTPTLYSIASAARVLDVSRDTIERLLKRGELPTVWVGSRRRIEENALRAYVTRNREGG